MKKIKSTNALNYINEHSDVMGVKDLNTEQMHVSSVREVVSIAEQDAEERAFQAVEKILKLPRLDLMLGSDYRNEIIRQAKEQLNGGQNDD